MSHFFYIHKDLKDHPGVNKIGIAISPYSAVRARQKFCWDPVQLDHLYFGLPEDIRRLETRFKKDYAWCSGKKLNQRGGQSELFKLTEEEVIYAVGQIIDFYKLKVFKVVLEKPYTASSSAQCPLGLPPEAHLHTHCNREVRSIWNTVQRPAAPSTYELLFR
jgi:hypothetical protein